MADYFRESKIFALFNIESLTVLAYSFTDSKCFALLIYRLTDLAYSFRDSKCIALFNLETLTVLVYSCRDSKCFALLI